MSAVNLSRGTLQVGDRPDWVHPEHYTRNVERITPLGQEYPVTFMLDKMKQGEATSNVVMHWPEKPFNPLTGTIDDIYTDTGLQHAATGAKAEGVTVIAKPATASLEQLQNIRQYQQVVIHSTSKYGAVKGYVASVDYSGALPQFGLTLLETDTNEVLTGTGLSWTILSGADEEVHSLGDAVQQHESDFYNYVGTDHESCEISERELQTASRIEDGVKEKKMERETDALIALNLRAELAVLEGVRKNLGTRYYPGGLRYFLANNQSGNVIDWRTDTTYSSSSDSVVGGSLLFLRNVLRLQRTWKKPQHSTIMAMSSYNLDVIDNAVLHSGQYTIDEGTNEWGLHVKRLRGLSESVDLIEDPLFTHYPSLERTIYILVPKYMRRHQMEAQGMPLTRKKGLRWIPWSNVKKPPAQDVNGENYITRIKGGYERSETYSFKNLRSFVIVDNFGYDKA